MENQNGSQTPSCPGLSRASTTNFLCFRKAWMAGTSLDKPGHDEELVETDLLPAQLADEIQHRVGEAVIAVARHHVAGSRDVDGLGVRHQIEEIAHMRFVHEL